MRKKVACSPYQQSGGIVYFARMVDKIRLHQAGELREDLIPNLGISFDAMCCEFLGVTYEALQTKVAEGLSDHEILEWAGANGYRPRPIDKDLWNSSMTRRGWNDDLSAKLEMRVKDSGFGDRADVITMFDYIDADEDRPTRGAAVH